MSEARGVCMLHCLSCIVKRGQSEYSDGFACGVIAPKLCVRRGRQETLHKVGSRESLQETYAFQLTECGLKASERSPRSFTLIGTVALLACSLTVALWERSPTCRQLCSALYSAPLGGMSWNFSTAQLPAL